MVYIPLRLQCTITITNICTACFITCCKNKKKILNNNQRYRTVKMPKIKAIPVIWDFARCRAFILKCNGTP